MLLAADYFSAREKYSKIEWGREASPRTIAAMQKQQ